MNREPCCEQDLGGSHYHCPDCDAVTSMMGHWIRATFADGTPFEGKTCVAGLRLVYKDRQFIVEPAS